MADEATYAGDDYVVTLHGLKPYDDELAFLSWAHVEPYHATTHRKVRTASFAHPSGTALHDDPRLGAKVEEHFKQYGRTPNEVVDHIVDLVHKADPWTATYGSGWYEHEAGHAVRRIVRQGYTRHQAAHIIADLSPQNPWYGTVNKPEMGNRETAVRYGRVCMDLRQGTSKRVQDGMLHVTDDDVEQAYHKWGNDSRLVAGRYDISSRSPAHWDIGTRDLAELPEFHSYATRAVRSNAIASALGIRHSDDLGPKTYPFHHNIMDPHGSNYVTNDTWMVDAAGFDMPRSDKPKFLQGRKSQALGVYKGLGQAGLASCVISATHRLNDKKPVTLKGNRPLLPMHTQAIAWCAHQDDANPKYQRVANHLKDRPWGEVFGWNFGSPHTY